MHWKLISGMAIVLMVLAPLGSSSLLEAAETLPDNAVPSRYGSGWDCLSGFQRIANRCARVVDQAQLERLTGKKIVTATTSVGTGETSIPNRLKRGEIDQRRHGDADSDGPEREPHAHRSPLYARIRAEPSRSSGDGAALKLAAEDARVNWGFGRSCFYSIWHFVNNAKQWAEFIDFIQATAPAALDTLSRTVGNLARGMAEMWMAFSPLNNDFSSWMVKATADFDAPAT